MARYTSGTATKRGGDRYESLARYYTPPHAALGCLRACLEEILPLLPKGRPIRVLEGHVGAGCFVEALRKMEQEIPDLRFHITAFDLDSEAPAYRPWFKLPSGFVPAQEVDDFLPPQDFLEHEPTEKYDLVLGNPPYGIKFEGKKRATPVAHLHILHARKISYFTGYLLRQAILETASRHESVWTPHPVLHMHTLSYRIGFMRVDGSGELVRIRGESGQKGTDASAYAFFTWAPDVVRSTFSPLQIPPPPKVRKARKRTL